MRHQALGPAIRDGLRVVIRRRTGSEVAIGGSSGPLLKRVAGPEAFLARASACHPIPPGLLLPSAPWGLPFDGRRVPGRFLS